jgi:hypothetical protein
VNLIFLPSTIIPFSWLLINLISNHQTNRDEKGVRERKEEKKKKITGEKRKKGRKKKRMLGYKILRMKGRKINRVRDKYEHNMEISLNPPAAFHIFNISPLHFPTSYISPFNPLPRIPPTLFHKRHHSLFH